MARGLREHPPHRAGAEGAPVAVRSVRTGPAPVSRGSARAAGRRSSRRLPVVSRPRRSLRRHHQRLSVRRLSRRAGQDERLRARTGATTRGCSTRWTSSRFCGGSCRMTSMAASPPRRSPTSPGCPTRASRIGRRSPPTSRGWPKRWSAFTRRAARCSTSTSSRNPTACSRTPPRRSSSSSGGCSARRRLARRSAGHQRRRGARCPPRAHPRLFRLLSLRRGIRGPVVALDRFRRRRHPHRPRAAQLGAESGADRGSPPRPANVAARLQPFVESTYLHQVVARRSRGAVAFSRPRRRPAIGAAPADAEWRIHFHVPLFTGPLR